MNTAPRQAAFAALVGANDADDAAWRLGDLASAKACDDATAAAVLVHCCGAEARANGFYGAVAAARRGQAKDFGFGLKLAFWDALRAPRRTGEALEAAARRATNLGKLLGGLLGPDLALGAALGRVDADALRAPACCFLVVAALRGLLEGADDATFAAALRAPGDAPSLDALYAFANAKLRPSPATRRRRGPGTRGADASPRSSSTRRRPPPRRRRRRRRRRSSHKSSYPPPRGPRAPRGAARTCSRRCRSGRARRPRPGRRARGCGA